MSEERSWAEETVVIGGREEKIDADAAVPAIRRSRRPRRSPGGRRVAGVVVTVGAVVIFVGVIAGGGGGADRPEPISSTPHQSAPIEEKQKPPSPYKGWGPVRRQAGALEVGIARPAPKAARSAQRPKAATVQAPEAPELEAAPVYESAPEPVAEPEPSAPAPAPVAETPARVEFGM